MFKMKKALLVIDMQNDYLWEKRKSKFTYNTEVLVSNVNKTIKKYKEECDVIYVSHLIQNIITNRILFGYSIENTKGAELYSGLNIVSNLKFNKYFSNAYKSKKFYEHMKKSNYDEIILCGLDLCGCVYYTSLGALKENKKVYIVENATGCKFSKQRYEKIKNKLKKLGVTFI